MSDIPDNLVRAATDRIIENIHSERATLRVQRIANGHSENDPSGVANFSYAEREQFLIDAEERLHKEFDN